MMLTQKQKFSGIFTALVTPFGADGSINESALRNLIQMNIQKGVNGFYVCGSTGEAFLMSVEERKRVMKIVRDAAPEQVLIAHVGAVNERDALELSQAAAVMSYDAVSSVAPFYYKYSAEEIREYYFRIAEKAYEVSRIPTLVYHIPAFSGVNLGLSDMATFLEDDRFLGVKYTSSDFFLMERIKERFPEKVVLNGYDEMFLAGISMGADGGIGSTYNFLADRYVAIRQLVRDGQIEKARDVQKEVNRIIQVLMQVGVMQGEKEVLNQLGYPVGVCRHPFKELTAEGKELVKREIVDKL